LEKVGGEAIPVQRKVGETREKFLFYPVGRPLLLRVAGRSLERENHAMAWKKNLFPRLGGRVSGGKTGKGDRILRVGSFLSTE